MRRILGIAILIAAAVPMYGQRLAFDVPGLADRASKVVEVTLDGPLLRVAAKFLSSGDPDERSAREIAEKLQGIYVKSYEFDKEGEYDQAVVERLRAQVSGWKKIVTVREKFRETNDIYVDMRGEEVIGLAIINAEPRELTLINIVGPIDLDKLSKIEGQFGIPRMKRGKFHDRD
jgi:hypothetical protein